MGGNARAINRETGEIIAISEKIDLSIFSRTKITRMIIETLQELNSEYSKMFGCPIWKKFEIVKQGKIFTGSSAHLFNKKILNKEFSFYKPLIGDIDLVIPQEVKGNFELMMHKLENQFLIFKPDCSVHYTGQDRTDFGHTFLGVFRYNGIVNIQIDFEYGEYVKGEPSEWSKFSHSSNWEDIINGLKGVHHKFLLINLVRTVSKKHILTVTPTSTLTKIKLVTGKKAEKPSRTLAFSVDKGLRVKFEQLFDDSGNPITIDNRLVYRELPTSKSTYIRDIPTIYRALFNEEPTSSDLQQFGTYSGLTALIAHKLTAKKIVDLFCFIMNENLFGKHAQLIEKYDINEDYRVKIAMIEDMFNAFPRLKIYRWKVREMANEYYKKYTHA